MPFLRWEVGKTAKLQAPLLRFRRVVGVSMWSNAVILMLLCKLLIGMH